jgi:N-acylneuraminate cytidylyltransferase
LAEEQCVSGEEGFSGEGMNLAIIPARGGSKGIPRKNIRLLCGKPLLAHSVEHALQSGCVDRVLVSTDDHDIARAAWQAGAEVVWRPEEISTDTATSESALLHALDYYRNGEGRDPDLVVFLQATSPLREAGDVRGAVETLTSANADSLLSVSPLQGFLWRIDAAGAASYNYDYHARPRRQDAPEDVVENGSIYVFKPWVLRQCGNRLGGNVAVYRMGPQHYFQIDEPEDFGILEALLKARDQRRRDADFAAIRMLVLDFDGVMTDNRVFVDQEGIESVACSRSDGMGISRLKACGVKVLVLSTEVNPVVAARCRKLEIRCEQGVRDKAEALRALLRESHTPAHHVAYIGNDLNDLGCMAVAGYPIAVVDAAAEVRIAAKHITRMPGGHGAVREVCDLILESRKGVAHAHASQAG